MNINPIPTISHFFDPIVTTNNIKGRKPNITGLSKILDDEFDFFDIRKSDDIFKSNLDIFQEKIANSIYFYFIEKFNNSRKDLNDFVNSIIKNNGLLIKIEGKVFKSNIVVGENCFVFFNDNFSESFFVSFSSPWKYGFPCLQITFLEKKITLNIINQDVDDRIKGQYFIDMAKVFNRYLNGGLNRLNANQQKKDITLTNYNHPHIGHNVWNGLSGWGCLNKNIIKEVKCLAQSVCYDFDFKNIDFEKEKKFDDFNIESEMPLFLKSDYISKDISFAIESACNKKLESTIKKYNLPHTITDSKLLIVNLRTGNRTLENNYLFHKEVITSIIRNTSCYVIVDGMNTSSVTESSSHKNISLAEEIDLADSLCDINKDRVFSIVGSTISENISIASCADVVLAPWGAGLAKYSWVCRTDCVVYSSSNVLKEKSDLNLYSDKKYFNYTNKVHFIKYQNVKDLVDINQRKSRWNFLVEEKEKKKIIGILQNKLKENIVVENKCANKLLRKLITITDEEKVTLNLVKHKKNISSQLDTIVEGDFRKFANKIQENLIYSLSNKVAYIDLDKGISLDKSLLLSKSTLYLSSFNNKKIAFIFGGYFNRLVGIIINDDNKLNIHIEEGDYKNTILISRIINDLEENDYIGVSSSSIENYLSTAEPPKKMFFIHNDNANITEQICTLDKEFSSESEHVLFDLIMQVKDKKHYLDSNNGLLNMNYEIYVKNKDLINELIIKYNLIIFTPISYH